MLLWVAFLWVETKHPSVLGHPVSFMQCDPESKHVKKKRVTEILKSILTEFQIICSNVHIRGNQAFPQKITNIHLLTQDFRTTNK